MKLFSQTKSLFNNEKHSFSLSLLSTYNVVMFSYEAPPMYIQQPLNIRNVIMNANWSTIYLNGRCRRSFKAGFRLHLLQLLWKVQLRPFYPSSRGYQ